MSTIEQSSPTTEARSGSATPDQMRALIAQHMAAEAAGDVAGACAVYTDDVQHDVVGAPSGVGHGKEAASAFYEMLTSNTQAVSAEVTREYFGPDSCTVEHLVTVEVPGQLLGIPGNGKQATFRMLHVFEFRNGLISRENVWLDGASIAAQLGA